MHFYAFTLGLRCNWLLEVGEVDLHGEGGEGCEKDPPYTWQR